MLSSMAQLLQKLVLCLILALTLDSYMVEGLRVLGIFPIMSRSHFSISEKVMRVLAERGHQVDVYSHFPLDNPPRNYTDYSIQSPRRMYVNNVSYTDFNVFLSSASIRQRLTAFGEPVCNLLDQPIFQKLIHDPPTNPPYDVIVIELYFSNCFLAFGQLLRVPTVMVAPTMLYEWLYEPLGNPTNFALEPGMFTESTRPNTFLERVRNVVQTHWNVLSFNHFVHTQDAIVEKYFGPGLPNVVDMQRDVALTLVNHHHAVNGARAFTPNVVPVGGLHIPEKSDDLPEHIQTFLDESIHGFIYVSFGSMVRIETFPQSDLEAFYKTFQNIAPVRVLMKIAKPEELPKGLPSNVINYHWLPQLQVLKHKNIKAFVSHGGLMSTLESIYHGVPMVGFPLFSDQHLNIESYVEKNAAIKLDVKHITEKSFFKAVKDIITNPVYKQSAEKISRAIKDAPLSAKDTAAFWIEYIVRHGKDALRPPTLDLPWWQAYSLDVYIFLISIALVILNIITVVVINFSPSYLLKRNDYLFANGKVKKN